MILFPFTLDDAYEVNTLLHHCHNYAPETSQNDNPDEIVMYFQDAFVLSTEGGRSYVLRNSSNQICAFVTVDNRISSTGAESQYITGLYTKRETINDFIAEQAFEIMQDNFGANTKLYVNVHPANTTAISYWEARGYRYTPKASDFTNCDNERLRAYEKVAN